jgi:hypothetical protein
MFVGVSVTVGAVRRFGVVGAAVAVLASAGLAGAAQAAQSPRAKAATPTGSACGNSAALPASAKAARALAADTSPFDIAKWVGEKTAGGAVGAVGGLAFNEVLKLTGLKDKLEGPDPILARLDQIEKQLEGVNERLDRIASQIDALTKEVRLETLNKDLGDLCKKVVQVEDLYANNFIPSVQAGVALGNIWADYPNDDAQKYVDTAIGALPPAVKTALYPEAGDATCSDLTDKSQLVCNTPKQLVNYRLANFRAVFTLHELNAAPEFISNYLTVHAIGASVMVDYGKYLLTNRTLTHPDSESLRDIYNQFAQAEALAAWMSLEYHAATSAAGGLTPEKVLKTYKDDRALEEQELSPMIPEGDVINLEQKNAAGTRNHTIWALATTKDESSWPINVESNNNVTTTADGATNAVNAFNNENKQSCSGDPVCFTNWKIPSTVDLKALLSDDCKVDTTKTPPQLPATCKPVVGTVVYPNVVKYLAGLNPTSLAWNGVFCRGLSVTVSCAAPADQHNFIWTTDRRSHETKCGYHVGFLGAHYPVYTRIYSLRVGLPLNFTNISGVWPIYPIMPTEIPAYNAWDPTLAHTKCDQYTLTQIPLPTNKGIVLVTDSTGMVDFMAQPGSAAVQDTTARTVADHAAADAKHYGRHHHGRFSGLSLRRLRDEVPEARSGEPGYLIAAHAIDGGAGFTVTARGEGTEDTFTITDRPSGAVLHTCTRVDGGAGRHGCRHVKRGHGRW